jgi:hypothetical protein
MIGPSGASAQTTKIAALPQMRTRPAPLAIVPRLNCHLVRLVPPVRCSVAFPTFGKKLAKRAYMAFGLNIPEFIDYAKANPSMIKIASAGTGSLSHVRCVIQVQVAFRTITLSIE